MGRLPDEFLSRIESFADRVLDVVEVLEATKCPRRRIEKLGAAGTSVGANAFEADEAMSRPDFVKTLSIVNKELNETRFWLRLVTRRGWIPATRLTDLLVEAETLKRIIGAMIARTRENAGGA
jgi:four helix bundle protein